MVELNTVIGFLYFALLVILGVEWSKKPRGEIMALVLLCANGLAFVYCRLSIDDVVDVDFFNIWSAVVRMHTILTLICIEAFRLYRMIREKKGGH